jgi:3-hydroxyacyl-[acyl-carrier-protein] dehydratase
MSTVLRIAPDHPACAGHFPGNPMVPGAWLLAAVLGQITADAGLERTAPAVKSAKFFHPVRPGDSVDIDYTVSAQREIRFQCAVAGVKVMAGVADGTARG